ncbi:hypothetical protein H6778_03270 [Candidatus Nomurabacteria bacterium]|nr:hypothetical protein [Myxococcales bacterium]MCB9812651.1 hypothetical protein [Candidatus Nomurabacteria bacterium]
MFGKKKRRTRPNREEDNVNPFFGKARGELFAQPEELGACDECTQHKDDGAYSRQGGSLFINCLTQSGLSKPQTEVSDPFDCEHHPFFGKKKKDEDGGLF